ncbi:MAG: selenium-dependent molybdenum cofactor biosynthesis protein YqeB [Chloroflexota bacterium]
MTIKVIMRGGGDLASGVAARLHRVGMAVLIAELPQPLVVRRLVAFAEAVYANQVSVEDITAQLVDSVKMVDTVLEKHFIPVMVDPQLNNLAVFSPDVLVDARMLKLKPKTGMDIAPLVIGLGPGFMVGENCHAVIETLRGHHLGRVIWEGQAAADTGTPEVVAKQQADRVLRAPADGEVRTFAKIGDKIIHGQLIAEVGHVQVKAPFDGVLRGMVKAGLAAKSGMKIGDLDPRNDPKYSHEISDKALAVGGGVLEAILSQPDLRAKL